MMRTCVVLLLIIELCCAHTRTHTPTLVSLTPSLTKFRDRSMAEKSQSQTKETFSKELRSEDPSNASTTLTQTKLPTYPETLELKTKTLSHSLSPQKLTLSKTDSHSKSRTSTVQIFTEPPNPLLHVTHALLVSVICVSAVTAMCVPGTRTYAKMFPEAAALSFTCDVHPEFPTKEAFAHPVRLILGDVTSDYLGVLVDISTAIVLLGIAFGVDKIFRCNYAPGLVMIPLHYMYSPVVYSSLSALLLNGADVFPVTVGALGLLITSAVIAIIRRVQPRAEMPGMQHIFGCFKATRYVACVGEYFWMFIYHIIVAIPFSTPGLCVFQKVLLITLHLAFSLVNMHYRTYLKWKEDVILHSTNATHISGLVCLMVFVKTETPALLAYCIGNGILILLHLLYIPNVWTVLKPFLLFLKGLVERALEKSSLDAPLEEKMIDIHPAVVNLPDTSAMYEPISRHPTLIANAFCYAYGHDVHRLNSIAQEALNGNLMEPLPAVSPPPALQQYVRFSSSPQPVPVVEIHPSQTSLPMWNPGHVHSYDESQQRLLKHMSKDYYGIR
eukprot:PhF_6_TR21050/c0_g1_i1/m.30301